MNYIIECLIKLNWTISNSLEVITILLLLSLLPLPFFIPSLLPQSISSILPFLHSPLNQSTTESDYNTTSSSAIRNKIIGLLGKIGPPDLLTIDHGSLILLWWFINNHFWFFLFYFIITYYLLLLLFSFYYSPIYFILISFQDRNYFQAFGFKIKYFQDILSRYFIFFPINVSHSCCVMTNTVHLIYFNSSQFSYHLRVGFHIFFLYFFICRFFPYSSGMSSVELWIRC